METNRIRQFCTLVETKNLRRAAELLNLSHGALSKSLQVLQREIGYALFIPQGRGLATTDAGLEFYQRARRFLGELDSLLNIQATHPPAIRLATSEVFSTYFMTRVLSEDFLEQAVSVFESVPGQLEEALLERRADLAITYEPIPQPGLDYLKICRIELGIFGQRKFQNQGGLEKLPFVVPLMPLQGTPSGARGLDGFPDDRFKRTVRYRVDLLQTALQLTGQGLAVVFLPAFLIRLYNAQVRPVLQLQAIRSEAMERLKPHRFVYLVKREATPESREMKIIALHLRLICRTDTP